MSTFAGCPSCPICDGPAVGHAPRTRPTYLRCVACGHAWFPSHWARKAADAFTASWEQRQRLLAGRFGLLPELAPSPPVGAA